MEKHGPRMKINIDSVVDEMRRTGKQRIKSDTQGSYTGITPNGEPPVQDADDL